MTKITSTDNKNFKRWILLLENKGIKKHQQFITFGEKVVIESLAGLTTPSEQTILTQSYELLVPDNYESAFFNTNQTLQTNTYILPKELFARIDIFGTNAPLLTRSTPNIKSWPETPLVQTKKPSLQKTKTLTVLCPMGDPSNLGAFIRSAMAFNVDKIVLLKESANPFHPKCIRATSGSILKAPLYRGPSINSLQKLANSNWLALDTKGIPLPDITWPYDATLLIGEEGPGVPKNLEIVKTTIPMNNKIESLNASVAGSIACFYHSIQR